MSLNPTSNLLLVWASTSTPPVSFQNFIHRKLEEKEEDINKLHADGDQLLAQNHPGKNAIEVSAGAAHRPPGALQPGTSSGKYLHVGGGLGEWGESPVALPTLPVPLAIVLGQPQGTNCVVTFHLRWQGGRQAMGPAASFPTVPSQHPSFGLTLWHCCPSSEPGASGGG